MKRRQGQFGQKTGIEAGPKDAAASRPRNEGFHRVGGGFRALRNILFGAVSPKEMSDDRLPACGSGAARAMPEMHDSFRHAQRGAPLKSTAPGTRERYVKSRKKPIQNWFSKEKARPKRETAQLLTRSNGADTVYSSNVLL
jgi:hypothetical protein